MDIYQNPPFRHPSPPGETCRLHAWSYWCWCCISPKHTLTHSPTIPNLTLFSVLRGNSQKTCRNTRIELTDILVDWGGLGGQIRCWSCQAMPVLALWSACLVGRHQLVSRHTKVTSNRATEHANAGNGTPMKKSQREFSCHSPLT